MAKNGDYGPMQVAHYFHQGVTEVRISAKESWQDDFVFSLYDDGKWTQWKQECGMDESPVSEEKAAALTALLGSRQALHALLSREEEESGGTDD